MRQPCGRSYSGTAVTLNFDSMRKPRSLDRGSLCTLRLECRRRCRLSAGVDRRRTGASHGSTESSDHGYKERDQQQKADSLVQRNSSLLTQFFAVGEAPRRPGHRKRFPQLPVGGVPGQRSFDPWKYERQPEPPGLERQVRDRSLLWPS